MDDTPFECDDCGRRFGVIWNNDGQHVLIEWCPFCGGTDLILDPDSSEDA